VDYHLQAREATSSAEAESVAGAAAAKLAALLHVQKLMADFAPRQGNHSD
jgi:hypothetical protein